jgi:hypothetical protein
MDMKMALIWSETPGQSLDHGCAARDSNPNPRIKSLLLLRTLRPTGVNPSVHTVIRPDSWHNPLPHNPSGVDPFTTSEHTRSTPTNRRDDREPPLTPPRSTPSSPTPPSARGRQLRPSTRSAHASLDDHPRRTNPSAHAELSALDHAGRVLPGQPHRAGDR